MKSAVYWMPWTETISGEVHNQENLRCQLALDLTVRGTGYTHRPCTLRETATWLVFFRGGIVFVALLGKTFPVNLRLII